jgi:hypothetical protein
MTRKCEWCGRNYDTTKGSSMYCEENPNYTKNKKYRKMNRKHSSIVRIGAMIMPPNLFTENAMQKADKNFKRWTN